MDAENLIAAVVLRDSEKEEKEFALISKENLTIVDKERYLKTTWETPVFKIDDIDNPENEIEKDLNKFGFKLNNYRMLDSGKTPISQSFSNQLANFMLLEVEKIDKNKKDGLSWFSLKYIQDFLELQQKESDYVSSEITIYSFLVFLRKFGRQINFQTLNGTDIFKEITKNSTQIEKQKDIFKKSPRFNVVEVQTKDGEEDIIATSKNSIGAIYYKVVNGKVMIGLQKQIRSPFLTSDKYQGVVSEMIGGMCEGDSDGLDNVIRECREETGYSITREDCKPILGGNSLVTLDASELTKLYKIDVTGKQRENLDLDKTGEFIDEKIKWIDLRQVSKNIEDLSAPIGTKLAILLLDAQLKRDKKKEIELEEK